MNNDDKTNAAVQSTGLAGVAGLPYTKDIEFCENRGCAFNADTGKCSSTFGQCYGYFPPKQ